MDARGHYSATDAKGMATDNQNVRQKLVSPSKVARSNEDGEEASTCVNVEKPRPSENSKKRE